MYWLERNYNKLVHLVEKQAHSKFKRKPALIICKGGRPRGESEFVTTNKGTVKKVTKSTVCIPRRMARENRPLAMLTTCHELREELALQNSNSLSKAHRIAKRAEKSYRRKLGIRKSGGWLMREHYG